jgi:hypothetical protein
MANIEVRVTGKGSVVDGQKNTDASTKASCDLCQQEVEVVASVSASGGQPFACKDCLRQRLEAMTVSAWMLRETSNALPWGKVSG